MVSKPYLKEEIKQTVEVQILGQRMVLKAEGDPRHIEHLVTYVKRKIDEVAASGTISSSKQAVLAALNIADDYFRALEECRELKRLAGVKWRPALAEASECLNVELQESGDMHGQ